MFDIRKVVETGGSRIFEDWHAHAGISAEEFIREVEWLRDDPAYKEYGPLMTRGLGCTEKGMVRLHRVRSQYGGVAFYSVDTGLLWGGGPSLSPMDRI